MNGLDNMATEQEYLSSTQTPLRQGPFSVNVLEESMCVVGVIFPRCDQSKMTTFQLIRPENALPTYL